MTKLEYNFKSDVLFKSVFVQYPDLLKRLVAVLLAIKLESIGEFVITNPEIPPEFIGDKLCRLDINMTVDGQRVDLEIQVRNEHDYPERTLFYWAREYSSSLPKGGQFLELPRVIVISIVAFTLFDCTEYYSEYRILEVTRRTELTDRLSLRYFELPKLPDAVDADNELELWLRLFDAETEEELKRIESMEVTDMEQAVKAYRHVTATDEFKNLERMRFDAACIEASALGNARRQERKKWEGVVEDLRDNVAEKDACIAEKDSLIADKDTRIAEKDARIAELEKQLADIQ
jgi:predicted transposase/invertase (TIGR01784 family)